MRRAACMVALFFAFVSLSRSAMAEIEKIALDCDSGICFYWWPKVSALKGWHDDREAGYQVSANVLVPDGSTFANAQTVLYAKALYKLQIPAITSVDKLVESDAASFRKDDPGIVISRSDDLTTGDGQKLKVFTYFPSGQGNWEKVAYGEEKDKEGNDFFLIFVVSSRTKQAYEKAEPVYKAFIHDYREKP